MNNSSIGIFDSGIGGLTVAKEIIKALPNENIIYLGDTARVPYGARDKETIKKFAAELTKFLLKQRVKALVVACNTMSAVCLPEIKDIAGDIPIIDVIAPTVSFALSQAKSDTLGVIGTRATIDSGTYEKQIRAFDSNRKVISIACPLFVPIAEEGLGGHSAARLIAQDYLSGFSGTGIDTLILGCTHYPLLAGIIQDIIGNEIKLIDSGVPTAGALKESLIENDLLDISNADRKLEFFVTDSPERVYKVANLFFDNNFPGKLKKITL